jgi:hypothetical protein
MSGPSNGSGGNGGAPHGGTPNGAGSHLPPAAGGAAPRFVVEPWRPPRARAVDAETVDLGDVARTVGRGWRTAVAGALVGLAAGAAVALFVPARWPGLATVLVRNANDPTSSLLTRFGIGADLGGGGGALGSVLKSSLETELQLLGSRDVLGEAVDSVGLHVRVLSPHGVPSRALVVPTHLAASFRPRTYVFARQARRQVPGRRPAGRRRRRPPRRPGRASGGRRPHARAGPAARRVPGAPGGPRGRRHPPREAPRREQEGRRGGRGRLCRPRLGDRGRGA